MWEVFEHRRVVRQLRKLPLEILKRYEKWKDIVAISGPQGLRLIIGFNDEALSGGGRVIARLDWASNIECSIALRRRRFGSRL